MNNELSKSDFLDGMKRLFVLKVESRLTTNELTGFYSKAFAGKISSAAWTHCVDLAISTQSILPTPAWFLEEAQKYEQASASVAAEAEAQESRARMEAEFPASRAVANIERLSQLTRDIGRIKE